MSVNHILFAAILAICAGSFAHAQNPCRLKLQGLGMTNAPYSNPSSCRLVALEIYDANIEQLALSPTEYQGLEGLSVAYSSLRSIDPNIYRITSIETLVLCHNTLSTLPHGISQMTNMVVINLEGNRLTSFPTELSELPKLLFVSLGSNEISALPESAGDFPFWFLGLQGNNLETIGTLATNCHIGSLNLSDNSLHTIPESMTTLTNLTHLDITGNPIPISRVIQIRERMPWCKVIFDDR